MWKSVLLGIGIVLATGLVIAQDHDNAVEKKIKAEIAFSADTRVGQEVLKAGEYAVVCDTKTITFTSRGEAFANHSQERQVLRMPCKGKELAEKSTRTEVQTATKNGAPTLVGLLLKGSSVQHSFD